MCLVGGTVAGQVFVTAVGEADCKLTMTLYDNRLWDSPGEGVDGKEGRQCTFAVAVDEEQRLASVPVAVIRTVQARVVEQEIPVLEAVAQDRWAWSIVLWEDFSSALRPGTVAGRAAAEAYVVGEVYNVCRLCNRALQQVVVVPWGTAVEFLGHGLVQRVISRSRST